MPLQRTLALLAAIAFIPNIATTSEKATLQIPTPVKGLFESHCFACHDVDTKKGNIRLDNLEELTLQGRLELLNKVKEQVFIDEMPPKKKLGPTESEAILKWVSVELSAHNASKLEDKLRYYKYGNYINHNKLFSGEIKEMPFTPARRWRINELIYTELVNNVLELSTLKKKPNSLYGIVKPFNLPSDSGVKYYDTEIVETGQFLTLLSNAKWIVSKQLRAALQKSGDFQYPETYLTLSKSTDKDAQAELRKAFPDEQWNPGRSPIEFERVVMSQGEPSDETIKGAISYQFKLALQREPTAEEMTRYLQFTKETIKIGGAARALEKALISVLMEPDFLYRSEFGDGSRDELGRTKLTPREASYAIAYALTDRVPDAALVRAVSSGGLSSKEGIRREVERMLADTSIEKSRMLRFFQDYFGYYNIYNVFKDEERFVGAYNQHRVVSHKYIWRIPGKVSKEADALVQYILKNDKDVLQQLLTTDKYFVQHNGNNEEMTVQAAKAAEIDKTNRDIYAKLKGFKGDALIEAARQNMLYTSKDGKTVGTRSLFNDMSYFELLYGKDGMLGENRKAVPRDNEGVEHSIKMYNLDYRTWSYEPVQPVKIENRMGMLTHPAWLVSFSQNAHTDPVRRGKWIREKLLAGVIQDVPITVDAKVPEDPHRTLRQRFAVTESKDCWSCHKKMNPLGYAFESYDDFGRFRTEEMIEYPENILSTKVERARDHNGVINNYKVNTYKTLPVDARGVLDGTGDLKLDGEVKDAHELIAKLAQSDRVRQSFIRNVFRYFMGRNEMLSDSKTLIEADRAYVNSGGSFKALVVSLLTSDSFIYRK